MFFSYVTKEIWKLWLYMRLSYTPVPLLLHLVKLGSCYLFAKSSERDSGRATVQITGVFNSCI